MMVRMGEELGPVLARGVGGYSSGYGLFYASWIEAMVCLEGARNLEA